VTRPSDPHAAGEDGPSRPADLLSIRWWVRDRNGELTLGQWPNPALSVWIVTVVVGWTGLPGAALSTTLAHVGKGALIVWSLDELLRGSSPFRRLLGALVLAGQLFRLFTQP